MTEVLDLRQPKEAENRPDFDSGPVLEDESLISWSAPAHSESARRNSIIAGSVLLIAGSSVVLLLKDWTLAILLFLGSAMLLLLNKKRQPLSIAISERGVHINDKNYFYRDLASFWIEYQPGGIKELSLGLRHWYLPHIKLPLGEQGPLIIREALVKYLPEREHASSLLDLLIKKIF